MQIFNKFWNENPKLLRKVVAVTGDVGNVDLGLSPESKRKLLDEVTIIFHVAATLKLDANLKDAVNMNTEGTLRLLQLAVEMKNLVVRNYIRLFLISQFQFAFTLRIFLQAFVHTSTAYCHCDVPIMEERVYAPPEDPHNVMNLVHWMDRDLLHEITEKYVRFLLVAKICDFERRKLLIIFEYRFAE